MAWFVRIQMSKGYKSQRYASKADAQAALNVFLYELNNRDFAQLGDVGVRASEVRSAEVIETDDADGGNSHALVA
jgi:hypothetical protein